MDSEQFTVEKISLHPDFRYMLTQPDRFDIALLRLDRPVAYRDNMLPICLPTKDYPLVGKVGVVAGWGKTDNSFGKTGTNLLNKVNKSRCLIQGNIFLSLLPQYFLELIHIKYDFNFNRFMCQ